MNTKDLPGIAIVIRMKLLSTAGKQITTLTGKVIDRKSRLIPRKVKETIHCLKNLITLAKFPPEIWLPNLR